MKNNLFANCLIGAMVALITAGFSARTSTNGYDIKGSIKGINSGTVELQRNNSKDRTFTTLNSVVIKNGEFELKGQIQAPEMMTIKISPGNWLVNVFVENSSITVKADTAGSVHYDYTKYGMSKGANLKNVQISGSTNQADVDQFNNNPEKVKLMNTIVPLRNKYEAEKDKKQKEEIRSEITSVVKSVGEWELKYINNFVVNNPSSAAGTYLFYNYYLANAEMPLSSLDNMMAKFSGEATKTVYYSIINDKIAIKKALLPGNIAPDFTLLKRDSSKFTLSLTRGKYIMLDFWASWCVPCREAIPHWKSIYATYKDKGFEIVSVSDDSRWADWRKAMDFEKMPWTQTCDEFPVKNMPARIGTMYETHFIPFYVLLDKEGRILVYTGDEAKIDEKLTELFGK
jgi:thiol-disulfide isomerase/thioredoxin